MLPGPAGFGVIVSLNEIELTLRKAALGAGLPLGLAEETGRAAAWLAGYGLPAVEPCLAALDRLEQGADGACRFRRMAAGWRLAAAAGGMLSAIHAGAAAADHLRAARRQETAATALALAAVDAPLLLAATLAASADGAPFQARWQGRAGAVALRGTGDEVGLAATDDAALTAPADAMQLGLGAAAAASGLPPRLEAGAAREARWRVLAEGVRVDPGAWRRAGRYAARCLVPASARSRLTGAGAGQPDSD